jgi:DnaK suppressor protein
MTRSNDIRTLRELLHRKRRDILQVSKGTHDELQALKGQERDPEFEEAAQTELADYTLSRLLETQRRELMLIDAALQRIEQKVYGECIDCGADIPYERLEALPFALRCEEDATRHELETLGGPYATPSL